ncbi:hypothetical protein BH23ACT3_BH23ACT3_20460 [soil metagenome]
MRAQNGRHLRGLTHRAAAPAPTFYGGYAGCFADPDGHVWEIAHNPGFPLAPDGTITIPDLGASPPSGESPGRS